MEGSDRSLRDGLRKIAKNSIRIADFRTDSLIGDLLNKMQPLGRDFRLEREIF
jgi:hypothetical protein